MHDERLLEALDALFLSPHPDDVELFCGGTVARLVQAGRRVAIVDLSAGERASNGSVEERRAESQEAARALGLRTPRRVLGLPDAGLDDRDPEQLRIVVDLLRETRPRVLFAPHPKDRHPDHEAGGRLARRAMFFAGLASYEARGEPHRVETLYEYPCHWRAEPSFLVDVSPHMDHRRAAIEAYRSQFVRAPGAVATPINQSDFLVRNEARLREWGAACGVEFAEGFLCASPPSVDRLDFLSRRVTE
jgi:bacillithiol biosynthesis deacetylase BshB1